jgi:hypothetical protein
MFQTRSARDSAFEEDTTVVRVCVRFFCKKETVQLSARWSVARPKRCDFFVEWRL